MFLLSGDFYGYRFQLFYENAPLPKAYNNFGVFSSKPTISKKLFGSVSDDVIKSGFDRHKLTTTNLKDEQKKKKKKKEIQLNDE